MTPPPQPFRLVYRTFDAFEFDPATSGEVFELRGFDLAYARQMFPGYMLEREDTRGYGELRFQVIGEVMEDVLVVAYAPRENGVCSLITAWEAEGWERDLWYERYS